jgi:hypothetical protein
MDGLDRPARPNPTRIKSEGMISLIANVTRDLQRSLPNRLDQNPSSRSRLRNAKTI